LHRSGFHVERWGAADARRFGVGLVVVGGTFMGYSAAKWQIVVRSTASIGNSVPNSRRRRESACCRPALSWSSIYAVFFLSRQRFFLSRQRRADR
jgi:hypothetical protein